MEKLDKEFMIFRIVSMSRWSEKALQEMTVEEVKKIYNEVVYRQTLRKV